MADSSLFSYATEGEIPSLTHKNQNYSITFTIVSVLPLREPLTVKFIPYTSDFTSSNQCNKILTAGESCTIKISLNAKKMGKTSASLIVKAGVISVLDKNFITTVGNVLGHFVFQDSHGDAIKGLNLKGDDTGIIQLANTGDMEVTGVSVSLPEIIKDYFSGSCLQSDLKLKKDSSCQLSYSLPTDYIDKVDDKISAQRIEADNAPTFINLIAEPKPLVYENIGLSLHTNMAANPNALDK